MGDISLVSCYVSPNSVRGEFSNFLTELREAVRSLGGRVIVCGDFNSKSKLWGARITDRRGILVEDWAAELDLRILNTGKAPTCVRPQGVSIIDLSWASPSLKDKIKYWRVLSEVPTLSDHVYISFTLESDSFPARHNIMKDPKWSWKKINEETFQAAAIWYGCEESINGDANAEERANWIASALRDCCDAGAPRASQNAQRSQVYWWNEEVADLRRETIVCRRKLKRHLRRRRRGVDYERVTSRLQLNLRRSKQKLRTVIMKAKGRAWQELIDTIEEDPWGLPYRLVLRRLRKSAPALTETIEHCEAVDLVMSLFPDNVGGGIRNTTGSQGRDTNREVPEVGWHEVVRVFRKRPAGNSAPGPDGIPMKVLRKLPDVLLEKIRVMYECCLKEGIFPSCWKKAKLVLIPKGVQTANQVPKARPICLLNNIGKCFERILLEHLKDTMRSNGFAKLAKYQFGFREGKSTVDALELVRSIVSKAVERGDFAVAVSLDIKNAFNSIPWVVIKNALLKKR